MGREQEIKEAIMGALGDDAVDVRLTEPSDQELRKIGEERDADAIVSVRMRPDGTAVVLAVVGKVALNGAAFMQGWLARYYAHDADSIVEFVDDFVSNAMPILKRGNVFMKVLRCETHADYRAFRNPETMRPRGDQTAAN